MVLYRLLFFKYETLFWCFITSRLFPVENDSDAVLHAASQWVSENLGPEVPWHFTAFHPDYKMMDHPPTPPETLTRARSIARSYGLRYVYTGNVHDEEGGSTFCHACGALLIGRDWYRLTAWHLSEEGRCRACGARCAGVFESLPGSWGARRQPVRLSDFDHRT